PYRFVLHHPPPPAPSTLSLHDALPILPASVAGWDMSNHTPHGWSPRPPWPQSRRSRSCARLGGRLGSCLCSPVARERRRLAPTTDRKSTRLNSSHVKISYAVFCLKKKK